MKVLAGTSGFSYAPWRGTFYPEDLPADEMLAYYAARLPTVEINNSFYRMPTPALLARWAAETPATFSMVLKAPRRITHIGRLKEPDDPLARLAEVSSALGDKRGPVLFQLPPNLRADEPRLANFLQTLARLAPGLQATFEFRHPSWNDPVIHQMLADHGAALCLSEDDDDGESEIVPTTSWGYLRLRRTAYDDAALVRWAARIGAQPWQRVHVFFKHEDAGVGPRLATRFLELVGSEKHE